MKEEKYLFSCFQMICLLKKFFLITTLDKHFLSLNDPFFNLFISLLDHNFQFTLKKTKYITRILYFKFLLIFQNPTKQELKIDKVSMFIHGKKHVISSDH